MGVKREARLLPTTEHAGLALSMTDWPYMTSVGPSADLLSVVVPVRNAESYVCEQLNALAAQSIAHRLEVVIVDDASTDRTAQVVDEWILASGADNFRILRRKRRGGPNASRNEGVRNTTAAWVLFCDGDDVVADDWAQQLTVDLDPGEFYAGRVISFTGRPMEGRSILGNGRPPNAKYDSVVFGWGEWKCVHGGNMAFHRSVLDAAGGFDEWILRGGTEVGLSIRAQQTGAILVERPEAVLFYRLPEDAKGQVRRAIQMERGRAYLRWHYPTGETGVCRGKWLAVGSCLKGLVRGNLGLAPRFVRLTAIAAACSFWTVRVRLGPRARRSPA